MQYRKIISIIVLNVCLWNGAADGNTVNARKQPCSMDTAFYEALYEFSLCNIENAYKILDRAISEYEPSENWELYLSLYQQCFYLYTGQRRPPMEYNKKGKKVIEAIEGKQEITPGDWAKLWTLNWSRTPEHLDRILKDHPESPWAEWARWEMMGWRTSDIVRGIVKLEECLPIPDFVIWYFLAASELQRTHYDPETSIMGQWLLRKMSWYGSSYMEEAREKYNITTKLNPGAAKTNEMEAAIGAVRDLFLNLLTPEIDHQLEGNLWVVFAGAYSGGRHEDVVWQYFEQQRKRGYELPARIPDDKEEFLEHAEDMSQKIRQWEWKRFREFLDEDSIYMWQFKFMEEEEGKKESD